MDHPIAVSYHYVLFSLPVFSVIEVMCLTASCCEPNNTLPSFL